MFGLISNKRGVILVTSYMMVAALVILGSAFVSRSIAEKNASERGRDLKSSFWAAEAGVQKALWNLRTNPTWTTTGSTNNFGEGRYVLVVSDEDENGDGNDDTKTVKSTASVGGVQQQIEVELRLIPPQHPAFNDTLATGGDLDFRGFLSYAHAYGQTCLSGEYHRHGFIAGMGFDDDLVIGSKKNLSENVLLEKTTVTYPDKNGNGIENEFEDFVLYYRELVSSPEFSEDEVVHIVTDDTLNVHPFSFMDRRLVFVEGTAPGQGGVNIWVDGGTWGSDQDLTIVSTGNIHYLQPLQSPSEDSRLSLISWGDFVEGCIFISYHRSAIHTQGTGDFRYGLAWSSSRGTVIANQGIEVKSTVALKAFRYDSRLGEGNVPPGFNLPSGATGYTSLGNPTNWRQQ